MPEDWGDEEEAVAETIRDAALRYAAMGWKVIPVHGLKVLGDGRLCCDCDRGITCDSPCKHPYENDWTTRYYSEGAEICEIFDYKYPNANLGVVTGKPSGIWVLDVDTYKGGGETLRTVLAQAETLLLSGRVHGSGRGGNHHFFAWPHDGTLIKSRSDVFWKDCGVDVRGDRGFIVLPPSRTVHGQYTEQHVNPIPKPPRWLLDWVTRRSRQADAAPLPALEELPGLAAFSELLLELMGDLDAVPRYRRLWRITCEARQCGFTIGQAYALCLQWVEANQSAHPEVPGKWAGPQQAACVAADVSRNWGKLDAERAGLELALPFSYQPDAAEVASVVSELAAAGSARPGETIDWARIRKRLPDLEDVARDIAASAEEVVDWDRLEEPLPPPNWVIPDLIERGAYTLIYAREGSGKSLVLQQQMGAAVAGKILAADEGLNVLYLDMENDWTDLHERFNAAGLKPEQLRHLTYRLVDEALAFNTPAGARQLLGRAYHHRPDVVVIDTMTRFLDGEQNAPEAPNAFFKLAVKPLTAAGVAVVVLDHMAKDERVRGPIGSKAKTTAPHVVWRMERRDDNSLLLELEKNRKGHCPPYLVAVQNADPLDFTFTTMSKEEYVQDKLRRDYGVEKPPQKGRKAGQPRVPAEVKLLRAFEKLARHEVPMDASAREAMEVIHRQDDTADRTWVAEALKIQRQNGRRTWWDWTEERSAQNAED